MRPDLVFTHRMTDLEIATEVLLHRPDLTPFTVIDDDPGELRLAEGGELVHQHVGRERMCGWVGPDGWLDHLTAGSVVACRVSDGVLSMEVLDDAPGADATQVERMRDLAAEVLGDDEPPWDLDALVDRLTDTEPGWFAAPAAPISKLLVMAGYAVRGQSVAPAGYDWDAGERTERLQRLALAYGLRDGDAERVAATLDVLAALGEEDGSATDDDMTKALETLSDADRARMVLDETVGMKADEDGHLARAARRLRGLAPADGDQAAAVRWLEGRAVESAGGTAAAEALLAEALELSPGWSPAAEDMASFSEDRGDAGRALELLLRAGAGNDDGTVQLLRRLRAGGSETGRNDPCPCGSGRKYKACHMGKEGIPLARRVGWLWNRAGSFMQRSHGRADLLEIAALIGGPYASSRQVLNLALEDGVVSDIALHEGGWFDRWLEARGALMPADERDLAEQWRSCDHGVYEVVGVSRGTGLTLRSAGDRTEISVTDGLASRTSHRGMWLFTRLVPDGTGALQIVAGGTPVETDAVEDLMATLATRPTHLELAAALGDAAVRTS